MAKRKAAAKRKAVRRKAVTTRRSAGRTSRSAGKKKVAAAKKTKKTASRRKAASAVKKTAKPAARKKTASRRTATASRKTPSAPKKAMKNAAAPVKKAVAPAKKTAPPAKMAAARAERTPARSAPGLNRERRTMRDDDIVPTPPSSLDFDRSASAARSGRRELRERYAEHTETSPAMTGGDVDADWESAYSVGDEAPGGDNPTPDQDLVDDIGRAVGVEYQDNEELKGEAKISKRDRNRWELDPASSDDWDER
jgi:Family of unknown function (DUF6335)